MIQDARTKIIEVFFYYSEDNFDEELRKKLAIQLNISKSKISVNYYYPSEVSAGTDKEKVKEHLITANLIIVLISPDIFALENYEDYKKLILERKEKNQVTVIPVLLRPCPWELSDFKDFQPLPKDRRIVTESGNIDTVLTEVAKGIIDAVKEISGLTKESEKNIIAPEIPRIEENTQDKSQTAKVKRLLKSISWYGVRNVVLSSMWISFLVILVRFLGLVEPSEIWLFDNMMRFKPHEEPDKNILIIQVTPEDIRNQDTEQRQGSLTDKTLFTILNKLLKNSEKIRPKAVGLDIHRDFETKKDTELSKLLKDDKNNPIFAVCYLGDKTQENPNGIKPPPEFINNHIGFSDFLPDKEGVIRRHILRMDDSLTSSFCRSNSDNIVIKNAFSLELARHFLSQSEQRVFNNENYLQIGNTLFESIYNNYCGGYSMYTSFDGYQILLNYRISCEGNTCSPENVAPKVTVADVLKDDFLKRYKDFVKDKIVLIGVTDSSYEAPWSTPFSSGGHRQIPGVIIQAQMVSQLISAVSNKRPLLQVWSIWLDMSWIFTWSLIGGTLFQSNLTNKRLTVLGIIVFFSLPFGCYMIFIIPMFWIPCIPAILSFFITGGMVLFLKLKFPKAQKTS